MRATRKEYFPVGIGVILEAMVLKWDVSILLNRRDALVGGRIASFGYLSQDGTLLSRRNGGSDF